MWLVYSVRILVTELKNNSLNLGMILSCETVADESLEFKSAAFALVVKFVVERLGDVGIHGWVW